MFYAGRVVMCVLCWASSAVYSYIYIFAEMCSGRINGCCIMVLFLC